MCLFTGVAVCSCVRERERKRERYFRSPFKIKKTLEVVKVIAKKFLGQIMTFVRCMLYLLRVVFVADLHWIKSITFKKVVAKRKIQK